jgi:hypothetical protein
MSGAHRRRRIFTGQGIEGRKSVWSVILRCEPTGPARSGRPDDRLREPRRTTDPAPRPHPSRAAARPPQDDGSLTSFIMLAAQPRPSFADQSHEAFASKKKGRRSAGRRNCPVGPRHAIRCCHPNALRARPRVQRDALAFRRSTAVLARLLPLTQPRAAFPGTAGCKREDPPRRQCSELLADRS